MSLLIQQNDDGKIALNNFFSAPQDLPLTILGRVKVDGFSSAGTYAFDILHLENAAGDSCIARIQQGGSTNRNILARAEDEGNHASATVNLEGDFAGRWVPFACVFRGSTDREIITQGSEGQILRETNDFSRSVSALTDAVFFGVWSLSDIRIAQLALAGTDLSDSDILEYFDNADVIPDGTLHAWSFMDDWGAGNVPDLVGDADLTPAGTWQYSDDNPVIVPPLAVTAPSQIVAGSSYDLVINGDVTATEVTISDSEASVVQIIDSQNYDSGADETTITTTIIQGNLPFQSGVTITVALDDQTELSTLTDLASENYVVNLTNPITTEASVFNNWIGDTPETGWQYENDTYEVGPDGIPLDNEENGSFQHRAWTGYTDGWTAWQDGELYDADNDNGVNLSVSFTTSINEGEVTFTNTSTYDGEGTLTYLWNFDDGNTSTDENPVHTFSESGSYQVSLQVTDGDVSDTASETIEVTAENGDGEPTPRPPLKVPLRWSKTSFRNVTRNQSVDTSTLWTQITRSKEYAFMVNGTFDGATVNIEFGFMDSNGVIQPLGQSSELSFTQNSQIILKRLPRGFYVRVSQTNSGPSTEITTYMTV